MISQDGLGRFHGEFTLISLAQLPDASFPGLGRQTTLTAPAKQQGKIKFPLDGRFFCTARDAVQLRMPQIALATNAEAVGYGTGAAGSDITCKLNPAQSHASFSNLREPECGRS